MKKLFLLLALSFPLVLGAQDGDGEVQQTLIQNSAFVDQFAQVASLSINPYTSVFLTSLCSKLGFHNDFVSTNPFYDSWVVLIIFGVLFLFTAIIGTVISSNKVTAPVKKADEYLQNKAALIINAVIILLPVFLNDSPEGYAIVYEAGILSVSFKTMLILAVSTYMLFVIMTMRLFIDFLIFLSPIPFVDSALEIFKTALSAILVIISIVSPITSVIITVLMFVVSLLFLNRARRLIAKVEYLVIYPILNLFRSKDTILTDGETFSVLVFTKKKTAKFKKGKILRLEKRDGQCYLVKKRFLLGKKEELLSLEQCTLRQNHFNILLCDDNSIALLFNRSYHKYIEELAEQLSVEIAERAEVKINLNKGLIARMKNMFSKNDLASVKSLSE